MFLFWPFASALVGVAIPDHRCARWKSKIRYWFRALPFILSAFLCLRNPLATFFVLFIFLCLCFLLLSSFSPEYASGERKTSCRKSETVRVFGKPVQHRFTVFNTAVYPRYMFAKMREFIGRLHKSTFEKVTAWTDKSWIFPTNVKGCTLAERDLLLPDAELMGAFLWWVQNPRGLTSCTIRTYVAKLQVGPANPRRAARAFKAFGPC